MALSPNETPPEPAHGETIPSDSGQADAIVIAGVSATSNKEGNVNISMETASSGTTSGPTASETPTTLSYQAPTITNPSIEATGRVEHDTQIHIKQEPNAAEPVGRPFIIQEPVSLISDDEEDEIPPIIRTKQSRRLPSSDSESLFVPQDEPSSHDGDTTMISPSPAEQQTPDTSVPTDLQALLSIQSQVLGSSLQKKTQPSEANAESPSPNNEQAEVEVTAPVINESEQDGIDTSEARFEILRQTIKDKENRKRTEDQENFVKAVEDDRAAKAEQQRLAKEKADEAYQNAPTPPPSESGNDDDPVDEGISMALDSTSSRKRAATDAVETDGPKKRGRPKKSAAGQTKAAPKTTKGKRGGKAAPKKNPKKPAKKGPTMMNMSSIGGTNVFRDTALNADLADQPLLNGSTRRNEALKGLVASLPDEAQAAGRSDKRALEEACKAFTGQGSCSTGTDGLWHVRGMRTALKHYQVLGVAFMRRRETSVDEPRGGMLSDEMGLGKTVMMLTNIVNGQALRGQVKTTLIVATPALIKQWRSEIRKHTKTLKEDKHGIGKVVEYEARMEEELDEYLEDLHDADVVLASYHAIRRSYPKNEPPIELTTDEEKQDWWTHALEYRGILHRMHFHRVVLDEAQSIKNNSSQTSIACRALSANHYWTVTGTPVMNTLEEFYPYFKFIRWPYAGSMQVFKANFITPDDPDGMKKLHHVLGQVMVRRTHHDTLFGAKLLDLPRPKENLVWLDFNSVERQIYEIVKKRFIRAINGMIRARGSSMGIGHILTMILRLRQLTSHILLVKDTILTLLEREDFEQLNMVTEDEKDRVKYGASLLVHIRDVLKNKTGPAGDDGEGRATLIESGTSATVASNTHVDADAVGGTYGLTYEFRPVLNHMIRGDVWQEIKQRSECRGCHDTQPKKPHVTSCGHIYCLACLDSLQHAAARSGLEFARCQVCHANYTSAKPCEEVDAAAQKGSRKKVGKTNLISGVMKMPVSNELCSPQGGDPLPSAKTIAIKAQILEWLAEDPTVKIIIYCQFLPVLTLLEKVCFNEGWPCTSYTGRLTHVSRAKNLATFANDAKCSILLASLQCGGVGLNLTCASRVIVVDPWWNESVEQQAFCRVFRIGQERETRLTRFVVRNTIDEAMIAMKRRKQAEIDEAMDGAKHKVRLSTKELMQLFGDVGQDAKGRPFIFTAEDLTAKERSDRAGHPGNIVAEEQDEDTDVGNAV